MIYILGISFYNYGGSGEIFSKFKVLNGDDDVDLSNWFNMVRGRDGESWMWRAEKEQVNWGEDGESMKKSAQWSEGV